MNLLTEKSNNLHYIAWKIGVPQEIIASVLARGVSRFYKKWTIPKNGRQTRTILSPQGGLRTIQEAIYQRMLRKQTVSEIAHGFVPGRSIISALIPHITCNFVYLADMKNAFGSVPKTKVKEILSTLGFKYDVQKLMLSFIWLKDYGLPQGAPTSGALFNLACQDFDKWARWQAEKVGFTITRYADNIIISAKKDKTPGGIHFQYAAHNVLAEGIRNDRTGWRWIEFHRGAWDHEKIIEVSETHPAKALGAIITGSDIRLSGKVIRHFRILAYNAVLSGEWQVINGIKGLMMQWFGEMPPQIALSIEKAKFRLEQISPARKQGFYYKLNQSDLTYEVRAKRLEYVILKSI